MRRTPHREWGLGGGGGYVIVYAALTWMVVYDPNRWRAETMQHSGALGCFPRQVACLLRQLLLTMQLLIGIDVSCADDWSVSRAAAAAS